MAIFMKDSIVEYTILKHQREKEYSISPLKLQKTLYLLYAMWGGNANGLNLMAGEILHDSDLFEPNFQAWMMGPVDEDVYSRYVFPLFRSRIDITPIKPPENVDEIVSFIDLTINQVFALNDFTLLEITRLDKCWEDVYNKNPCGNDPIPKEAIINEYTEKLFG